MGFGVINYIWRLAITYQLMIMAWKQNLRNGQENLINHRVVIIKQHKPLYYVCCHTLKLKSCIHAYIMCNNSFCQFHKSDLAKFTETLNSQIFFTSFQHKNEKRNIINSCPTIHSLQYLQELRKFMQIKVARNWENLKIWPKQM